MDASFRSRRSNFRFILNSEFDRRKYHSPTEYYPRNFSRSRWDNIDFAKGTFASVFKKRNHFDEDRFSPHSSRKFAEYSKNSEVYSTSRAIRMKMDISSQSFDVLLKNTVTSAECAFDKEMEESSLYSGNNLNGPANVNSKINKTSRETAKEEETSRRNGAMKISKKARCGGNRQIQSLESDSILLFTSKPVENNVKLKSKNESKSHKRRRNKNKVPSRSSKLCLDIPADTLILCIDEEEAADILYGDIERKRNKKKDRIKKKG